MAALDQTFEGFLIAKMRVHAQIVDGIILVVGRRLENRTELEARDAQVCQIIQLLNNAL